MKHIIIVKKVGKKEKLSENAANTTALAEIAQVLSLVDLT